MSNIKKLKSILISKEDKCSLCIGSKCCQYITEPLDTPRSIKDFDLLLWQISHNNIHCFKDSSGWYLTSFGQCEHLTEKGQCRIYYSRPFICREHSDDSCEFDQTNESHCDLYFTSFQQIDDYCRKRFKSWDRRFD